MAFLILQNSTTADASDVNANFYHVAQGSRLPMGGNSLEATDSVYDLGSSAASWNNLFCQNIYINSSITTVDKSLWVLEAETTLSATASSIEFTGLNGDDDLEYRIICFGYTSITIGAKNLYMSFNGDSAANYGHQYLWAFSTTVAANRTIGAHQVQIAEFSPEGFIFNAEICPRNNVKTILSNAFNLTTGSYLNRISTWAGVWNNSDTLTSMKFYLNTTTVYFDPGTHIEMWKRG